MSATPESVTVRPGIAERLSRMIQLETVSAELDTRGSDAFEAFVDLLAELYPSIHKHLELERITDFGLLFRWPRVPGNPGSAGSPNNSNNSNNSNNVNNVNNPVVLMAHYDVVPVDLSDAWTFPPFQGRIADGWVYGRGALDDKGPLIVTLEAVENLLTAGFTPARDVYISLGGNEEVFGEAAQVIAKTLRDRGIVPWLVLDEGGAVVEAPLPFVAGTAAMVGVGEKGIATLRLTARGDGGHASAPPTITAVGRISRAVARLGPRTFPARTPRAISRMLGLFADGTPQPARTLLRLLATARPLTAQVFAALGGEPAALVRTTVAATMQEGGTAANVLPSQASATLNLRIALGQTVASTVRRVRRRIGDPLVTVEIVEGSEPSPESPTDNAAFALIATAVAASHPEARTVPYVMMAATDSRHFHRFSPAVYRFVPLAMSSAQRASIHGVDERVEISELERGELFHRTLLQQLQ